MAVWPVSVGTPGMHMLAPDGLGDDADAPTPAPANPNAR